MKPIDIILIVVIALVVGFAIFKIVKNKKKGKCCSCGCGCDKDSGSCH